MVAWVTAEAILADAGNRSPTAEDSTWAELCASAVSSGLDARLVGMTTTDPPPSDPPATYPELAWCALRAGTEAYKRREATFGITGYADLAGAAIRVARDYLEGFAPIIERYATRGLA